MSYRPKNADYLAKNFTRNARARLVVQRMLRGAAVIRMPSPRL